MQRGSRKSRNSISFVADGAGAFPDSRPIRQHWLAARFPSRLILDPDMINWRERSSTASASQKSCPSDAGLSLVAASISACGIVCNRGPFTGQHLSNLQDSTGRRIHQRLQDVEIGAERGALRVRPELFWFAGVVQQGGARVQGGMQPLSYLLTRPHKRPCVQAP